MKIPLGYCQCGCGQKTSTAKRSYKSTGQKKGTYYKFVHGHTHTKKGFPKAPKGKRYCTMCRELKDREKDFFKNRTSRDGLQALCKICSKRNTKQYRSTNIEKSRRYALRSKLKKFGVSLETYNELFRAQGGTCAICKCQETSSFRGTIRRLTIDHDHLTNQVRGLLCNKCNTAIGLFSDNPEFIENAAHYLKAHTSRTV